MADLGYLGIHVPEAYGGAGAGLSELIVVLEEIGRQVAPGPFLPTVMASAAGPVRHALICGGAASRPGRRIRTGALGLRGR